MAWFLKFDASERDAGIYGFNATLVGIATFFFFKIGLVSLLLLAVGAVVATVVTRVVRRCSLPHLHGSLHYRDLGCVPGGRGVGAIRTIPGGPPEGRDPSRQWPTASAR